MALSFPAPDGTEPFLLGGGLHALGDRHQIELIRQVDDGVDNRVVEGIRSQPGDEDLIDLDRIDGELLEMDQRRVPGPEVVEGQLDPELVQLVEQPRAASTSWNRSRSVISNDSSDGSRSESKTVLAMFVAR